MTVVLELRAELEERILGEANARGMSAEAYLISIIESTALPPAGELASLKDFEAAMDELAEGLDEIPVLAPEALTRENIYGQRG